MTLMVRKCAVGVAIACAAAACGDGRVGDTRPAAYGDAPNFDSDIDRFLREYLREVAMFADNGLDLEVREGRVAVRGSVDTEAERDELVRRIRAVPGVRDVDVRDIRLTEG